MKGIRLLLVAGTLGLALQGCGAQLPEPIRLSELGPGTKLAPPMVFELREGDRIPLELDITGDFLAVEPPEEPLTLVVKRRLYVHFDGENPPELSVDGRRTGSVGGALGVGYSHSKEGGSKVTFGLRTFER